MGIDKNRMIRFCQFSIAEANSIFVWKKRLPRLLVEHGFQWIGGLRFGGLFLAKGGHGTNL